MIATISMPMLNQGMAQIVIRNLDDAVIDALRRLAATCGTSTE
jgi:hypothetical protein